MIEVLLFRGKHPLYETMMIHPPEGISYVPKRKCSGSEDYTLYNSGHSLMRSSVNRMFGLLNLPRTIPILKKYDLVHSSRGFFVVGPNRYVVDLEHISSFSGMHHLRMGSPQFKKSIEKLMMSEKCRHILPHCRMARNTISVVTRNPRVMEKATVVYPSIETHVSPLQRKTSDVPTFLFYGEYFWKGGREFLESCLRLSRKMDFRVKYISLRVHPPRTIIKKAESRLDIEYIEGPISRTRLFTEVYPSADVFAMPTCIDTFGYAYLEAMSFGIPCIGTHHFAVPEIIDDEITGLLVRPPLSCFDDRGMRREILSIESADSTETVSQLTDAMERLASSDNLRHRMSENALSVVRSGRFSIDSRNRLLRGIYETSAAR